MSKKSSILKQQLIPVVIILVILTSLIVGSVFYLFSSNYTSSINEQNLSTAHYVSEAVGKFLDGAYNLSEEIVNNSDIISMETEKQHKVLASTVSRNPYLETIYIQKLDGVQTGRSSGTLGNRRDRWWFKQLLKSPKPFISMSYYSVATNMPCTSVFFPIYDFDEITILGNVGVDLKLDYLQSLTSEYSAKDGTSYSFILDGEGNVVAHPENKYIEEVYNYKTLSHTVSVKDELGNVLRDEKGNIRTEKERFEADPLFIDAVNKLLEGNSGTADVSVDGQKAFIAYVPIPLKGNSDSWGVVTVQSKKQAFMMLNKIIATMLITGGVALIMAIIIISALTRKITRPISKIIPVIKAFANGDFSERLELPKSNNEMDDIINAFNNVSRELQVSRKREHDLGEKLFLETQNLAVATKETAATSQDSNAAVKEIVATMEDSNALSENISHKIKDVASVAKNTSVDVQDGVSSINQNVEQLHAIFNANQQTINGMKELGEKIESIWDIVTLINSIADQAKIIAFNTELEVASAGEAGEPFRIVAGEIRRLSDGIIDGTKEIKEKITEIQKSSDSLILASESSTEKINSGYENAKELGAKFESIKSSSEITATSAQDITEIIQQQAIASEQILIAIKQISGGVENFSAATENISASAEKLRGISEELNSQMNNG